MKTAKFDSLHYQQAELFRIIYRLGLIEMPALSHAINKLQIRLIVDRRCDLEAALAEGVKL